MKTFFIVTLAALLSQLAFAGKDYNIYGRCTTNDGDVIEYAEVFYHQGARQDFRGIRINGGEFEVAEQIVKEGQRIHKAKSVVLDFNDESHLGLVKLNQKVKTVSCVTGLLNP